MRDTSSRYMLCYMEEAAKRSIANDFEVDPSLSKFIIVHLVDKSK